MTNERAYTPSLVLHVLRNPHGWNDEAIRQARLDAADEIERLRAALRGLTDMYCRTWDRVDGALVMMPDNIERFEKAHAAAQAALGDTHEPLPCARCAAIDARTQALEQLPKADRSLPNDDVEGASRDASCEHDLQKPNHTVDVDGPYDAKCRVCKEEWHIPHPTPQRPGPADLVGALQDVVHTDPGPVRVGKAFREASSEKAVK